MLRGASFAGEKKYAEGEPLLLEGYQGMLARKDRIALPDHYHLDLAHKWLVELYEAWSKPEKAAEWRAKATTRALAALRSPELSPSSWTGFELFKASRLLKGCLRVTPLKAKTSGPFPTD